MAGKFVSLSVHLSEDVIGSDLIDLAKFAEAIGITLVEISWPQAKARPLAA